VRGNLEGKNSKESGIIFPLISDGINERNNEYGIKQMNK